MKKMMKLSLVLAAATLAFSSCNCFKQMAQHKDDVKLTCTPEVLELNNGVVAADINVTFPEQYFNKKAVLKVTPYSYSRAASWPQLRFTSRVRR